jgi:hypothetical protein
MSSHQTHRHGMTQFWIGVGVAVLLTAAYVWLYIEQPFSNLWNTILSDSFTAVAAALSAIWATMVWQTYEKDDAPRRIWRWFAIALWLWTIAEIVWGTINSVTLSDVPVGWADIFWIIAYGFFGAALYVQYRILFQFETSAGIRQVAFLVVAVAIGTAILTYVLIQYANKPLGLDPIVNGFYPVGDLVIGLAALRVVHRFRWGALSFAWLGLFVFSLSDFLYAWLTLSGAYAWSVQQGNILSTISDVTYLVAYLIVALGCYAQWLLLHHGPIVGREGNESKS